MINKFEARDKKLHSLLENNKIYKIPRYQRSYDWSKDNALEFWQDLSNQDSFFFLGSFVFDIEEDTDNIWKVIDGQQRLTTITILLSVMWRINSKLKLDDASSEIKRKLFFTNRVSGKGSSPRLDCNEKIKDIFEKCILNEDWDGIFSGKLSKEEKSVKDVYVFFQDSIENELLEKDDNEKELYLSQITEKLYDADIVEIRVPGEDIAYELFETLNARGEDLTVADLLKNYIFSQMHFKNDKEGLIYSEETWKEIEENISDVKKVTMPKFIRYYWLSVDEFVTEKHLYRSIRKRKIQAEDLLSNLKIASKWLRLLSSGTEDEWRDELLDSKLDYKNIFNAIQGLRVFEVTQCYVLFLKLLMSKELISYDFSKIFGRIERFHFGYSAICKQPGNKIEKLYHKYTKKINLTLKDSDTQKITSEVQVILSNFEKDLDKESFESFEEGFRDLSYKKDNRLFVIYLIDMKDQHIITNIM
jgi:hypothetical protein